MNDTTLAVVPVEAISQSIVFLRGQKVIVDSDLAQLYGVTTKRLNEQVKRNLERFPADFMFRLTAEESQSLRSQNATSKTGRGGQRYFPYVFTEHGALMVASVLNTQRAVEVSIYVVRAFVRMWEMLSSHAELSQKLEELDTRLSARLDAHDKQIGKLIELIRSLLGPPERKIGFLEPSDSP